LLVDPRVEGSLGDLFVELLEVGVDHGHGEGVVESLVDAGEDLVFDDLRCLSVILCSHVTLGHCFHVLLGEFIPRVHGVES